MVVKKQNDVKECGPLVVQAIHKYFFKKWININQIKSDAQFGPQGMNIDNFIKLSKKYGIEVEAYEASCEQICESTEGEYNIALVKSHGMDHYIIFKYLKKMFYIYDSIGGKTCISIDDFKKRYQGILLTMRKGDYKNDNIEITNPFVYFSKNISIISWTTISIMITVIFTFTSSLFMKIIVDKIIPGQLDSTLTILSLSFAFIAILRSVNIFIKSFLVRALSVRIERDLTFEYYNKINIASLIDASKLTINDNLRRIGLIPHISGYISNSLFVLFNEFLMLIVSTSLLMWISSTLFAITLASSGLLALFTILFRFFIKSKYDPLIKAKMHNFNATIDMINQIKENKNSVSRDFFNKLTKSKYYDAKNQENDLWKVSKMQQTIEVMIEFITPIILVYVGARSIFNENMTIGSLLMFISIFTSFISPIKDICIFFMQFGQMQKNIELISFIINLKKEKINSKGLELDEIKEIKFKDVIIGYDKDIQKIKNFKINKSFKLIGSNGSGKSTFLNTIGTYIKRRGEIYFNNIELDYYSLQSIRNKTILISPKTYMPNITAIEFITLNNKEALKTLNKNIQKYNLASLMKSLKIDFNILLTDNGSNISSGQRQIILLLRLFAFKYELILLDEAFENIDKHKLIGISKAINDFQKGIIIEVSHSKRYMTKGKELSIENLQ